MQTVAPPCRIKVSFNQILNGKRSRALQPCSLFFFFCRCCCYSLAAWWSLRCIVHDCNLLDKLAFLSSTFYFLGVVFPHPKKTDSVSMCWEGWSRHPTQPNPRLWVPREAWNRVSQISETFVSMSRCPVVSTSESRSFRLKLQRIFCPDDFNRVHRIGKSFSFKFGNKFTSPLWPFRTFTLFLVPTLLRSLYYNFDQSNERSRKGEVRLTSSSPVKISSKIPARSPRPDTFSRLDGSQIHLFGLWSCFGLHTGLEIGSYDSTLRTSGPLCLHCIKNQQTSVNQQRGQMSSRLE